MRTRDRSVATGLVRSTTALALVVAAVAGCSLERFRPTSTWDAKEYLKVEFGVQKETDAWFKADAGEQVYYDVFGNIAYGAMARDFGLSSENAVAAANQPGSGMTAVGDDVAVRLGYGLVDSYPDGMTEDQFVSWFNSDSVQSELRSGGRVR